MVSAVSKGVIDLRKNVREFLNTFPLVVACVIGPGEAFEASKIRDLVGTAGNGMDPLSMAQGLREKCQKNFSTLCLAVGCSFGLGKEVGGCWESPGSNFLV